MSTDAPEQPPVTERGRELRQRVRDYLDATPDYAPEAIPDAALREWVSGPVASNFFRGSLTDAPTPIRTALITAGVTRRGAITPVSSVARGLARLCRRPGEFWGHAVRCAVAQCDDSGWAIPADELAELEDDPLGFHDSGRYPPAVVLLGAVLIGLGDDVLETLGASLEDPEDVAEDTRQRQAAERVEQLKAQNTELKAVAHDAAQKLRAAKREKDAAKREIEKLQAEIEQMRDSGANADDQALTDEQRARQRAETQLARLEGEVEALRAEAARVAELEQERDALLASRDTLVAEGRSAEQERDERAQIEAQVQQQLRTIADLRARLRDAEEHGSALPVENGPGLIRVLLGPVGRAVELASRRMCAGQPQSHDAELLQFGAALASAARTMDLDQNGEAGAAVRPVVIEEAAETETKRSVADDGATVIEIGSAGVPDDESPEPELATPIERPIRRHPAPAFTIRPVGGAGEIGGSAILVETRGGRSVLLDAGQRVKDDYGPSAHNQFHHGVRGVDELDAILVSHAHIDHVGSLPTLCRFYDEVPVLMSEPSRDLAEIMLHDSARIQHAKRDQLELTGEIDFALGTIEPAYDEPQVNEALAHVQTVTPHAPMRLDAAGLIVRFLPVSHVLGSCAIHITDVESGQTLLYTGDLGPIQIPQLTLPPSSPEEIQAAGTIVMESTYGMLKDSEREGKQRSGLHGRDREVQILFDCAEDAFKRGGHVLLPSFALGRTQELVDLIGRHAHSTPIYLAGMGERIFDVYDRYKRRSGEHDWVRPGQFPNPTSINKWLRDSTFEEVVAEVLDSDPGFIIVGPAMLSGGWSLSFLAQMVEDARHAIIFSGYLPRYTTTVGRLRHLGKGRQIDWGEGRKTIQTDWVKLGLSAHATGPDLRHFANVTAGHAEHVNFGLVHGEPPAPAELAEDINLIQNAAATPLNNGETWEPRPPN